MKSANIKPLKACPMCKIENVFATYEENARYRYECRNCGQYFEFNAPSQLAADVIFNHVNEIIKALECCITNDCAKCKAYDETNGEIVDCLHAICRNALDLINRQKAEIERLNVELAGMRGAAESYKIHYDKAQTKIKALKEALDGETVQNMRLGHEVERLNADLEKALKDEADIHISI